MWELSDMIFKITVNKMFEKIESEMKNFIRKLESIKKEKVILELKCIIAKLKNSLG